MAKAAAGQGPAESPNVPDRGAQATTAPNVPDQGVRYQHALDKVSAEIGLRADLVNNALQKFARLDAIAGKQGMKHANGNSMQNSNMNSMQNMQSHGHRH